MVENITLISLKYYINSTWYLKTLQHPNPIKGVGVNVK